MFRSAFFWDFTQRKLVIFAHVFGQPISPIFVGQAVQEVVQRIL